VQLNKDELGCAIDGDEGVEATFLGVHLGNVEVKRGGSVRWIIGPPSPIG
jgi:hypothetical protein